MLKQHFNWARLITSWCLLVSFLEESDAWGVSSPYGLTTLKSSGIRTTRVVGGADCCLVSPLFTVTDNNNNNNNNNNNSKKMMLMDHGLEQNEGFFSVLFRYMQASCMVGCIKTSLAVSRFMLSLDPLRDPMGVLLVMDYFALASMKETNWKFLIHLVESKSVKIYHRIHSNTVNETNDDGNSGVKECCGELLDMPNWAYSYALALYKLSRSIDDVKESETILQKANDALQNAVNLYPSIPQLLLEKNKIDVRGKSCNVDWPTVLVKLYRRTTDNNNALIDMDAADHIIQIFIQRNYKLWNNDTIVKWLFEGCNKATLLSSDETIPKSIISPAISRYKRCNPSDYEDTFVRTLPADINPLDPALVAPAVAFDHNRRPLRRHRFQQQQQGGGAMDEAALQQMMMAAGHGQNQVMLDPDMPMTELFWRSFMPWASVDGVPPPVRPPQPP